MLDFLIMFLHTENSNLFYGTLHLGRTKVNLFSQQDTFNLQTC